jgi:hypothetical protein
MMYEEQIIEKLTPIVKLNNDSVVIPNLSGVRREAKIGNSTATMSKEFYQLTNGTSASFNMDLSNNFYMINTQIAGNFTMNNPTGGTIASGRSLIFRIKSTNAQTFVFDTKFRGGTTALPTATTAAKTDYYCFLYNEQDDKWDYTGIAAGF